MFNTKKYNYTGGGLVPSTSLSQLPTLKATMNPRFTAPAYIDSRPYLIPATNQGKEPSCAGFTTAGYAQARKWRLTGEQKVLDGSLCYAQAKQIDGLPGVEGTTLVAAAQAGEELGWYKSHNLRAIFTLEELRYALHQFLTIPAGFNIDSGWNSVNTKTGYIDDPKNPRPLGGHAVLVCYYDKDGIGWQNSWGQWGASLPGSTAGGFGRMTWKQAEKQFMYALAIEKPWMQWRE